MATIYAKNKLTGEWERVGPAAVATDATLTLEGSPADAKVTGDAIRQVQDKIDGLTAEDVGALPADTEIPSVEGLASQAYVDEKLTEVIGGAPELLNTLDELSAALNDDENFATTVANQIAEKQDKLTFDETPTEGSVNPVTSGGIKSYVDSAQVQSDWNQSDENAADYIKNRPFYDVESSKIKVLEEIEINQAEGSSHVEGYKMYYDGTILKLVNNATYIVVWDGIQYECVANYYTEDSRMLYELGNAYLNDSDRADTGEPFYIRHDNYNWATIYYGTYDVNSEDVTPHTLEMYRLVDETHRIDTKYLPEGYPYAEDSLTTIIEETSFTTVDTEPTYGAFDIRPTVGEKYIVTFDGVEYICYAYVYASDENYYNCVAIGNAGLVGSTGGNNEPFFFWREPELVVFWAAAGEHTISIKTQGETVFEMDKKFIPAIPSDWNMLDESDKTYIKNKPFYANGRIYDPQSDRSLSKYSDSYRMYTYKPFGAEMCVGGIYHIKLLIELTKQQAPSVMYTFDIECDAQLTDDNTFILRDQENVTFDSTNYGGEVLILDSIQADDNYNYIIFTRSSNNCSYSVDLRELSIMQLKQIDDICIPDTIQRTITGTESQYVGFDADGNAVAINHERSMILKNINTTMPNAATRYSVAYGNGKFVTVCYGSSTSIYSEDVITWTETSLPSSANWRSVTYGNDKFVAVANGSGTAAYSEDGITWTETSLPSSANWYFVTYGNDKFVAVANNSSTAAYSEDGITWTETSLPSYTYWFSVAYGNGKFVAVASNSNTAAYSEDGITWTKTSLPVTTYFTSVIYNNEKFVAISKYSSQTAYSEDGITWTYVSLPSSANWYSVTYGNGKFVAVANGSSTVVYSYDGITWHDSIQYISQNDTDVTADTLAVLKHTHDEYLTEQVQANLSQTDSAQVDYVKGVIRQESLPEGYPYKEKSETVVLAEQEVSVSSRSSVTVSTTLGLSVGDNVRVLWDDTVYDCKVKTSGAMYIGNDYLMTGGASSGEPFCIVDERTRCVIFGMNENEETHSISIVAYSETIHPIAPEFLPEGYPYYGEPVETEVVPATTVEFDGFGSVSNVIDFTPTAGLTYLVNWKGTEYKCTAQAFETNGIACVVVGDGSAAGLIGNGEPFAILCIPTMSMVEVSQTGGNVAETVTISISEIAPEVHTMAEEFLPDNTFTIMFQYYNGNVVSSVTLEEIENALSDGKEIKAKLVYLTGGHIGGGSPMFYIGNAQCIHFDFAGNSAYINVYTCTSDGWEERRIPLASS